LMWFEFILFHHFYILIINQTNYIYWTKVKLNKKIKKYTNFV
jgi:hypothetical protein